MNDIFTIGHSNHGTERFLSLLRDNDINAIADVRSSPRTKVNPDFTSPCLEAVLKSSGISYVFLGEELGARSQNPDCYENGIVKYDRLARQTLFQDALDRIEVGSEKFRIALLCAEKEPLDCHRCILVSRHLFERGLGVSHILADGSVEKHPSTILRLKRSFDLLNQKDMFKTDEEITDLAYQMQEARIAYAIPERKSPDLVA